MSSTRRRSHRLLRFCAWICISVLTVLLILHLPFVQAQIAAVAAREASSILGASVTIESLSFNLSTLEIRIRQAAISAAVPDTSSSFRLSDLDLNVSLLSLFRGVIRVESLTIDSPDILLLQSENGGILLPFASKSEEHATDPDTSPFTPPPLVFDSIELKNARIRVIQPDRTSLLDLKDLSLSLIGDSSHSGAFSARVSSGSLDSIAGSVESNPIQATIAGSPEWNISSLVTLDLPGLKAQTRIEISPFASPFVYHTDMTATLDAIPWLACFKIEGIVPSPIQIKADVRNGATRFPALDAEISSESLMLQSLSIDRFNTTLAISDSGLLHADSRIQVGGGSMDSSVDMDLNAAGDLRIHSDLKAIDLASAILLPDSSHPMSGTLNGSIDGRIPLSDWMKSDAEIHLAVESAGVRTASISQVFLEVNAAAHDGRFIIDTLSAKHGKSRIDLSGSLELPDQLSDVVFSVDLPDVTPYFQIAGLSGSGSISLNASASGPLTRPTVSASGAIRSLKIGGSVLDIPEISARFNEGAGTLVLMSPRIPDPLPDLTLRTTFGETLSVTLESSDSSISGSFNRDTSGVMRIDSVLNGFPIERIRSFVPAPGNEASGTISASASVTLPMNASPVVDATITDLSIRFKDQRISIAQPARIRLASGTISCSPLDITSNDGSSLQLMVRSFTPGGAIDASMTAAIPDLATFRSLSGISDLAGSLRLDLLAAGTMTLPRITGGVDGSDMHAFGVSIDTLTMRLVSETEDATRITSGIMGINYRESAIPDLTAETVIDAGGASSTIRIADAGFRLDAELKPLTADQLEFDLQLEDISPERYFVLPPEMAIQSRISGRFRGTIPFKDPMKSTIDGQLSRLDVSSSLLVLNASRPIQFDLSDGWLSSIDLELSGPDASITASGRIPLQPETGAPSESTGLIVNTRFDAAAVESFQSTLDHIAGRVEADVRIAGSLLAPVVSGQVSLFDGILDSPDLPSKIEAINAHLSLDRGALIVDTITARFADGRIELNGRAECLSANCPIDASIRIRGVDSEVTTELSVAVESDLTVGGTLETPSIRGEVKILNMLYTPKFDVIGILNSIVRPARAPRTTTMGPSTILDRMTLDINVLAPEAIRIENSNLELDLGARIQIIGTPSIPGVMGTVNLIDGYLDLLRTEFEIDRGSLTFTDPWQIDPEVDINATAIKGSETIYLKIAGRASRPLLQLSSSSGLSHTEIVKLLAGVSMPAGDGQTDMTGLALQYAANSAALVLADFLSARTGLILIPFPTGTAGEHFLFGAGKRIGERVLIMYYRSQSDEDGDAVEFEFNLTQGAKLRARQNQDGSTSGGLRYRYEFH